MAFCSGRRSHYNTWRNCGTWIVTFISIVIGALGTVTKGLLKGQEDLEIRGQVVTIQTTALLRSARIPRRLKNCYQTLVRNHRLTLEWKTLRIIMIIISVLRSYQKTEKGVEYEDKHDTNCEWPSWIGPPKFWKTIGRVRNRWRIVDYPEYSILKID